MKKYTIFLVSFLLLELSSVVILPTIFLPKRWLDIQPGMSRSAVYNIIGMPDADLAVKGLDGWHNSFYIGASSLTVQYDPSLSNVVEIDINTKWGFEHKTWAQDYKKYIR